MIVADYIKTIFNSKKLKLEKGFTLVELLIVVSILLISVGVAGDLIISVIRSYNKTRVLNEIEQNGNYVLAKLTYDLRNAKSVSISGSNTLTLTETDSNNTSVTVIYTIQNVTGTGSSSCTTGTVTRQYGSNSAEPMTNIDCSDGVNVNTTTSLFSFDSATSPITVRIKLDTKQGPSSLNANSKSLQANVVFETSVVALGASQ